MVTRKAKKAATCLHDKKRHFSRGCCWGCWSYGQKLITSGERTDDDLVADGLYLPMKPGGRPRKTSGLDRKLAKAKR